MKGEEYFKELISGKRHRFTDRMLLSFLKLSALPYAVIMRLRAFGYRIGLLPSRCLPRPVISVGNLTAGGTGKTPAVLFLARLLMERGKSVAVLTRGYGGSLEGETRVVSDGSTLLLTPEEAGDEPCLLASSLPALMVVMGADRFSAGCLAMERFSPDIFLLDDGFQHQRLRRDLDILLVDWQQPFANGRTFPAGLLREPPSAAGRADLVIFTRARSSDPPREWQGVDIPSCSASHTLSGWTQLAGGDCRPFAELAGRRAVAFAGIADPAAFFDSLEREGVKLLATLSFPDHTSYGVNEMEALGKLKQAKKADLLITTGKDAVKLQKYRGIIGECLVARLELKLQRPELLVAMLEKTVLT